MNTRLDRFVRSLHTLLSVAGPLMLMVLIPSPALSFEAFAEAYAEDSIFGPEWVPPDHVGPNPFGASAEASTSNVPCAWATAGAFAYPMNPADPSDDTIVVEASESTGFSNCGDPKDAFARAWANATDRFVQGPPNSPFTLFLEIRQAGAAPVSSFPGGVPLTMEPTFNELFSDAPPEEAPGIFDIHLELDSSIAIDSVVDPTTTFSGTATLGFDNLSTTGDFSIGDFVLSTVGNRSTASWGQNTTIASVDLMTDANGLSPLITINAEVYLMSDGVDNLVGQPPAVAAGDANQDLMFDQLDLVQVQLAAKYLTGQPATWGEGDWNGAPGGEPGNPPAGDGLFNQLDIIAAVNAGVYLTGPYDEGLDGNGVLNRRLPRPTDGFDPGPLVDAGDLELPSGAGGAFNVRAHLSDPAQFAFVVPEPSSMLLIATGLIGLGVSMRHQRAA